MITVKTAHPAWDNNQLDEILKNGSDKPITDLELIDELIKRAKETGADVQFVNAHGRALSLDMAHRIRYDRGLDMR